jgi:hypothetical protein
MIDNKVWVMDRVASHAALAMFETRLGWTNHHIDILRHNRTHGDIMRKRHDALPAVNSVEELQGKLQLAIRTHQSAEVALLYLIVIREYKFDSIMFQELSKVCLSSLIFELIWIPFSGNANFVGLNLQHLSSVSLVFLPHFLRE